MIKDKLSLKGPVRGSSPVCLYLLKCGSEVGATEKETLGSLIILCV